MELSCQKRLEAIRALCTGAAILTFEDAPEQFAGSFDFAALLSILGISAEEQQQLKMRADEDLIEEAIADAEGSDQGCPF